MLVLRTMERDLVGVLAQSSSLSLMTVVALVDTETLDEVPQPTSEAES